MTDYILATERPWVKELTEEHGPYVLVREGERQIRQFADGFFTEISADGSEYPCAWQGAEFTTGVAYRRGVYRLEAVRQIERQLQFARESLQTEINLFIDTGEPVENLDAKKQHIIDLKSKYDEAKSEYDRQVLAPGRAMKALDERSRASQEAAVNARQGEMASVMRELSDLFQE